MNKIPFTERYRATSLNDLVLDNSNKELIFNIISEGNIPNLLLYSNSAGTGKTSMAKIIISTIGCDKLILNASSERGIDTIREKVSSFCKTMSMVKGVKKCVFLDEAEYLTTLAQASLRNLMEEVSSNAFFILTANYEDKIIEPIRSRCMAINFNSPNKVDIQTRLEEICIKEDLDAPYIGDIIEYFYPDIRSMVSALQAIKLGKDYEEVFKQEDIFKQVLKEIVEEKYDLIRQKIINDSIDVKRFVKWLFEKTVYLNLPFEKVGELCLVLSDIEKYISNGVTPKIILLANIKRLKQCLTIGS